MEEEREAAERKIAVLERRLEERSKREEHTDNVDAGEKEGPLPSSRPSSRVGILEAECGALRSSLQDIASMVAGEMEGRRPRVLVPGRSSLTPRRSKSADPSAPEATVSAVQAVLNAKQSHVTELSHKVQGLEALLSTNTTSLLSWETRAREAERELISATNSLASSNREREEVKLKCESLRVRLDKGEEVKLKCESLRVRL